MRAGLRMAWNRTISAQNRFGRKGIGKRTENRPPPTPAPCSKETNRPGGNQGGDLHFAHAAIKKCPHNAHGKQQKRTHSQGQNPHLRSTDWSFRRRVAATLRVGDFRRTGRRHIFIVIERAHVSAHIAACRGVQVGHLRHRCDRRIGSFLGIVHVQSATETAAACPRRRAQNPSRVRMRMKARQARRKVTASTNNKGWTAPEGYMMPTKSEGKKGRSDGDRAV